MPCLSRRPGPDLPRLPFARPQPVCRRPRDVVLQTLFSIPGRGSLSLAGNEWHPHFHIPPFNSCYCPLPSGLPWAQQGVLPLSGTPFSGYSLRPLWMTQPGDSSCPPTTAMSPQKAGHNRPLARSRCQAPKPLGHLLPGLQLPSQPPGRQESVRLLALTWDPSSAFHQVGDPWKEETPTPGSGLGEAPECEALSTGLGWFL